MTTIKAIIAKKLHQEGCSTDEEIRKALAQYLKGICFTLPGENNGEKNPIGAEFATIMFQSESKFNVKDVDGKDLHDKAVTKLIERIMEERDDLCDCPHLRRKLIETIA